MEGSPRHLLPVPLSASIAIHAAAVPFAAALGEAACPLLDSTGFGGVGLAMLVTALAACAGYWIGQRPWSRRWCAASSGRELTEADVVALFRGPRYGVLVHVIAFLAATLAGAVTLRTMYGHDVFNVRFWYSSMLVAGFVIVLHASMLEWMLARDVARAGSRSWRYRAPAGVLSLDAYFEGAVAVVEKHRGHVDKFLGDGLMAWFNQTPGTSDLGAPRAVAAAVDLLRFVEDLNAGFAKRSIAPIQIGVGLHAGDVVRGNLGTGRRKQWTVIGDTVNLASRMETMTKTLGRDIAFTAPVANQLSPEVVEPLGDHEIRGQPRPVACFSVRKV